MEEKMINILRHYRHDLLNKLQIVHGYVQMEKHDKVGKTLDQLFKEFDEERKLFHLEAPRFILWVISFNTFYRNFRLSYHIHTNSSLPKEMDTYIVSISKSIMNLLEQYCEPYELYEIGLEISENASEFLFTFILNGKITDISSLKGMNKDRKNKDDFEIKNEDGKLVFRFGVSKSE